MRGWTEMLPQAKQVVQGVLFARRNHRSVYEGDPTTGTEVAWAEMALAVLSSMYIEESQGLEWEQVRLEDDYARNIEFLALCGFPEDMPELLGMSFHYAWGSN